MDNNNKIITEELKQIVVLMNYNRSKTLMEQDIKFDIQQRVRNAEHLGISYDEARRLENPSTYDAKWDHSTAGWVELALVGAGVLVTLTGIGAPVGAALIGAGTVVGVADAVVYFSEGDPYMGTMMLALNLIPGGELASILTKKGGKEIGEQTIKQSKTAMEKFKAGGIEALTDAEKFALDNVSKAVKKVAPEVIATTTKYAIEAIKTTLKSLPLSKTIGLLMGLSGKLGKTVFKVGRIAVTVDLFWTLFSTPESWRTKMRNKSEFSKIMDMLYDGTLSDTVIDGLWGLWNMMWNKDGSENVEGRKLIQDLIIDSNFTEEDLAVKEYADNVNELLNQEFQKHLNDLKDTNQWNVNSEKVKSQKSNFEPVKFNNLMRGRQTIRKGQKGDVVRDIQRMLVTIGYDLGNTGKTKDGVDGDFGDTTEESIINFQADHDLEGIDGVVGEETSNKLYELYKEKK
jgi:hypothetical protein